MILVFSVSYIVNNWQYCYNSLTLIFRVANRYIFLAIFPSVGAFVCVYIYTHVYTHKNDME